MDTEVTSSSAVIEEDRRYRCMVLLNRSDRPGVWTYHCPRCTMPVAELVNKQFHAITDTMEIDNGNMGGIGVRCDGRFQGKRCNIWFYFSLNETQDNDVRS